MRPTARRHARGAPLIRTVSRAVSRFVAGPPALMKYAWHAPARAERGVMSMPVQAFCLPAEELSERIHVVWSQHSETLTSLSVCSSILSKHIVSVGSR